ncbi:MAG: heavy metal-binding domain-containing protein [Byssovorax sp.]
MSYRPVPALSDLSVTEFLTLSRVGFLPHGLVIGSSVFEADTTLNMQGVSFWDLLFGNPSPAIAAANAGEVTALSHAVRSARALAIQRMRVQAAHLAAEGVVGVRLQLEHHLWRGNHQVAKFVAMGTAVAFDHDHGPVELRGSPSLRLANGAPFTSDLSGQDFVALLRAGFRPITVASGTCIYRLDPNEVLRYQGHNVEIGAYTQAFFDARETAMDRLQQDLFAEFPVGHPDAPTGIVGMTVTEKAHRQNQQLQQGPPVVEFTAVGTAIAPLHPQDPRRAMVTPKPKIVVPLDR